MKRTYPSVLETARLSLYRVEPTDLNVLVQIYGDAETMKYLAPPWSRDFIEQRLDRFLKRWELSGCGLGVVAENNSGNIIGCASMLKEAYNVPGETGGELGFMILPEYRSKGYATEITRGILRYLFISTDLEQIVANPHPDNIPSNKVLEKAGFERMGERAASLDEFPFLDRQMLWRITRETSVKHL